MSIGLPKAITLFQPRWTVFWATTYSFELELFDNYLLRRLGDPPVNVTILADAHRLAKTWEEIPQDEPWRLRRANRDYLIRGYPVGSGSFHAKTYLFADGRRGSLLVGSGNLGRHGFDRGREVFCQFDSSDEPSLPVIAAWLQWMQILVERLGDDLVTQRWAKLRTQLPWLDGVAPAGGFVANLDRTMISQLVDGFDGPADELHVSAPFFDRDADALAAVIAATQPKTITVYAGKDLNVDGTKLVDVLDRSGARVSILGYVGEFVHAKLVAVVRDDEARLMSGSANLSRAALLLRPWLDPGGNIEAGMVLDVAAGEVRQLFTPPDVSLVALEREALAAHTYEAPLQAATRLFLLSARPLADGRVEVRVTGNVSAEKALFVSNGRDRQPLEGSRTVGPLPLGADLRVVWLESENGEALSNRAPVDDPRSLDHYLKERAHAGTGPRELDSGDMDTPIGQMLQRLNESYVFDVEDSKAVVRAQQAADEERPEAEDAAFWERLAKEELQRDPRIEAYERHARGEFADDDDLFAQLRVMLERTPDERQRGEISEGAGPKGGRPGKPWTPERRLQVRLGNVLERWSRKVNDPRLRWITPLAPVRNYAALVRAITECWERGWVPRERLTRTLYLLFSSFIAAVDERAFLQTLEDDERQRALGVLPPGTASMGASLAYLVLGTKKGWESHVFEWQTFLRPALASGVFAPNKDAALFVSLLTDREVPQHRVAAILGDAANHIDDPHWCRAMEETYSLEHVTLTKEGFKRPVTLHVSGVARLLDDPRLVALVREALEYREERGAVVVLDGLGADRSDRLSVAIGEPVYARVDGTSYESASPLNEDSLIEMEIARAPWRSVLRPAA